MSGEKSKKDYLKPVLDKAELHVFTRIEHK